METDNVQEKKLYAPEPPVRYCRRCGERLTWKDPIGYEYDELTGKPVMVLVKSECTHIKEETSGGFRHTQLSLYWPTKKMQLPNSNTFVDPEHWYAYQSNYAGLAPYAEVSRVEALVKSKKNGVDMCEEPTTLVADPIYEA